MRHEQTVLDYRENGTLTYVEMSHQIHQRPELRNEEIFASSTFLEDVTKHAFEVETNIAGHATGFIARYDSGLTGPTSGFLAEYDALPGLGHACGHNIIGTASVLAGVGLKQVINKLGGEIIILGCPAEEGGVNGSAKASYVKEGIIDELD